MSAGSEREGGARHDSQSLFLKCALPDWKPGMQSDMSSLSSPPQHVVNASASSQMDSAGAVGGDVTTSALEGGGGETIDGEGEMPTP